MGAIDVIQTKGRRNPMRQWLGIELSAYIVLFACLTTVAWTNHLMSGAVAIVAWGIAGCALTLTLRRIYRARHSRLQQASEQQTH